MNTPMTRAEFAAAVESLGEFGQALLATHDHWRARSLITGRDVQRLGLKVEHVTAWLTARGWAATGESKVGGMRHRQVTWRPEPDDFRGVDVLDPQDTDNEEWAAKLLAEAVSEAAHHCSTYGCRLRPIDLLEEMAAGVSR